MHHYSFFFNSSDILSFVSFRFIDALHVYYIIQYIVYNTLYGKCIVFTLFVLFSFVFSIGVSSI